MSALRRATVLLVLVTLGAAMAGAASATTNVTQSRIEGQDRFDTAVQLWRAAGQQQRQFCSDCVEYLGPVLVSGNSFADALVAGVGYSRVLLAPRDHLTAGMVSELRAWAEKTRGEGGTPGIAIYGGTDAVGDSVVGDLHGLGYNVYRVAGRDRYDTALQAFKREHRDPAYIVFLASGENFADALTIGPAIRQFKVLNYGLLLTTRDSIPQPVLDYLVSSKSYVMIVGGPAAVSEHVQQQLGDQYFGRIAGSDRYETAVEVAQFIANGHDFTGLPPITTAYLANGAAWPDALASAANVELAQGVLLLTPGHTLAPVAGEWLNAHSSSVRSVIGIGGSAVLEPQTLDAAARSAETQASG